MVGTEWLLQRKIYSFANFYDHISLQNSTLSQKAGGNSAHGHGMIIDKVSVPADLEPGSNDLLHWLWNMNDDNILW